MTRRELVLEYIAAIRAQHTRDEQFANGMQAVLDGNFIYMPITDRLHISIDNWIIASIGESNHDWLQWFLYEVSLMDVESNATIDGVEYLISTPEQLVDICMRFDE
jgi:hypothetical protein